MSFWSKAFVFVVFAVLGVSFWATTAILYMEFAEDWRQPVFEGSLWFDLMTHHSHVFLFFPLFGTIALFAFFLPAAAFVDMYWRPPADVQDRIPLARTRFIGWFAAAVAAATALTYGLTLGDETALWQIKRDQLVEGSIGARACATRTPDGTCARVTFPTALANMRQVSQDRERLTDLRRQCGRDPLIEQIAQPEQRRFCFVTAPYTRDAQRLSSALVGDDTCCRAMERFERDVRQLYMSEADNRSLLDKTQHVTLGLKIFFLLVILIISLLLAFRRQRITNYYGHIAHRIDRGVLLGAFAMMFLPLMNHAFLLATELLYGANDVFGASDGVSYYRIPYALSMAFVGWGFVIMLSFIRRADKDSEQLTKIIGMLASGVFVLNYDTIIDYAVRFAGPGAGNQAVSALIVIAGVMGVVLAAWGLSSRQRV